LYYMAVFIIPSTPIIIPHKILNITAEAHVSWCSPSSLAELFSSVPDRSEAKYHITLHNRTKVNQQLLFHNGSQNVA
jgi:hypothetical protein